MGPCLRRGAGKGGASGVGAWETRAPGMEQKGAKASRWNRRKHIPPIRVPAQAGTHAGPASRSEEWDPACAGAREERGIRHSRAGGRRASGIQARERERARRWARRRPHAPIRVPAKAGTHAGPASRSEECSPACAGVRTSFLASAKGPWYCSGWCIKRLVHFDTMAADARFKRQTGLGDFYN